MPEQYLRKIDLNLLIVLRTLLETSSVTRTAQRLGMSQPAVSRALASSRLLFKDPLLVKSGAKMLPTVRALELVEPLQDVVTALFATLEPPGQFEPQSTHRHFKIATTDYGATVMLPGISQSFFAQAPNAGLEVVAFSRQSFFELGSGDLDLVLYSDNVVPESLRTRNLYRESFVCLVRKGHPALSTGDSGKLSLEDFLNYAHILVTVIGGLTGRVDIALAESGHKRKIALWFPYFATAALAVAKSDLILTMPRRAAEVLTSMTNVEILEPPIKIDDYDYRMVWHERVQNEPAHAWLRKLMLDTAHEVDGD